MRRGSGAAAAAARRAAGAGQAAPPTARHSSRTAGARMSARRDVLARRVRALGFDMIVTTEPENLFYLTGFWGEAYGVMDARGRAGRGGRRATIIAPALEAGRAISEAAGADIVSADRGSELVKSLAGIVKGSKACADCQSYPLMMALKKAAPGLRYSSKPLTLSRAVKDAGEISTIRRASRIIDGMFELCASEIRAGMKESELQAVLMAHATERGMFDTGYRSTLNPLIVAGGPNGALPHAQVTGRRFADGDLIVVDLTLRHKGYVTDATRTFGLGRVPRRARDAYEAVRESQELGLRAARAGVSCADVDAACRDSLKGAGWAEYFVHSTGHGVGLDVHEAPAVSAGSKAALERGMVVTVEPGVYVPRRFGVRIEDTVVVRHWRAAVRPAPLCQGFDGALAVCGSLQILFRPPFSSAVSTRAGRRSG